MPTGKYKDLLKNLGFQSFLWTQFLGAFNDNLFKIVISMFAVNLAANTDHGGMYISLVSAVFILPYLLFSGYSGFVADAYNKRSVLIVTKSFEIVAVGCGLVALYTARIELLLLTLFLMALHSTFFSPAKYGIVPEMLPDRDLSRANGLLEMTTFIAIILGTSVGAIMFSTWKDQLTIVGFVLVGIAVVGTLASFGITRVPPPSGAVKRFKLNPWGEIIDGSKRLLSDRLMLLIVMGLTYFWFLGALLQMDILLVGKEVMGLDDLWIGILITFLAVGIGVGCVTAGWLSGDKVEPGLVPLGSAGMGIFSILIYYASSSYPRTGAALMMLGVSCGLFIVPLNALLQQKSGADEKGRLIATNNFLNTGGILLASGVLWLLRDTLDIPADKIIFIFGLLTIVSTVLLLKMFPDFLVRLTLWMLTHTLYNIKLAGQENVPFKGPALLVSNHVSFADGFLVGACIQRFVRFMIHRHFYEKKGFNWLLGLMRAIPISDGNRKDIVTSIRLAREELKAGHVVCIFAEGAITRTGNLQPFKKGFERIASGLDVPIIPVHLDRVWGSVFSFKGGRFFWKWPSHFPYHVTVSFGKPLPSNVSSHQLQQAVAELGCEAVRLRRLPHDLLHLRFIKKAKQNWFYQCMADSTGKSLSWGKALTASLLMAGWIRKNCRKQDMVAILLPSSVGGALANTATLLAGKVPVNLNFTSGAEAMAAAMNQCSIKTVITSRAFVAKAGIPLMKSMLYLEDMASGLSLIKKLCTSVIAFFMPPLALDYLYCWGDKNPDALATIIFTTGSTGRPKGVMLTHHNIVSNAEGFAQVFHLGKNDAVMGVLPFFHSFGLTATLWFPLIKGHRTVYHASPMDAATIGEMVRKHGATMLLATPTFYLSYAKKIPAEDFATLKYAVTGAEKLRPSIAKAFKEKFGVEMLEGYGCTELSPVVSVNVPDVADNGQKQTGTVHGTVGHPIPGVMVKVVDPDSPYSGEELPPGTAGLLLVKGPNVMKGYYNDPVKTAEVIKDGWYNTGDIATVGENGFITITDRLSRFSKIGGEMVPHIRIEEMMAEILLCECAVTALPDEKKGERLVAFYTGDATPADVWALLSGTTLPKLWIPKRENLRSIEAIPTTASGKKDLRRIKELAGEEAGATPL